MLRSGALKFCFIVLVVAAAGIIYARFHERGAIDLRPTRPACDELERLFASCNVPTAFQNLPSEMYRRILGADEILYKEFKGLKSFQLYIARWKSDNPYRYEAADHSPDRCWPSTGWRPVTTDAGVNLGERFAAAHIGRFSNASFFQNVVYWCVYDGKPISLPLHTVTTTGDPRTESGFLAGSGFLKFWVRACTDAGAVFDGNTNAIFSGVTEAYFIRINSSYPIAEILETSELVMLYPLLKKAGVVQ